MYDGLETPAVAVELDAVERNIRRLVENAAKYGLTHRSVELDRFRLRLGAKGVTCAKLGEAEVMAETGIDLLPADWAGKA